MIFLRHHLHEALKIEYLKVKDPRMLWDNLKDRYHHQKTMILPRAPYEWVHLRLQDFKSVSEYNSAMFRITSQLTLPEKNNELLMKNHETCPTGTALFPEANVATFNNKNGGRDRGSNYGRGRDRVRGSGFGRGNYHGVQFKNTSGHKKWQDKGKMIKNDSGGKTKGAIENRCYRCGVNHWARIDNFDIDSFGIDSLDVDPKDQNDTTHLDVSDFLTNE
ncbi:hypothetical protein Tco_0151256 [Tanacetum coccineum]